MSMRLSVLIDANGKTAITEVTKLSTEVDKLGKASEASTKGGQTLQASTKRVGASANQAQVSVQQLTAAEIRNAAAARKMAAANQIGAGGVANLTAQFNDIGVMLAAGQNPLQLAIQQGTQITQVLGNSGAAQAGKALKSALLSMVSPMSLLTIGTIAGGAALLQWATRASEADGEAEAFAESLANIRTEASDAATAIRLFYSGLPNANVLAIYDQIAAKENELAALREKAAEQSGRNRRSTLVRADALQVEIANLQEQLDVREDNVRAADRLNRIQEQANRAGADYMRRLQTQKDAAEEASALIAELQREADIREVIARYGEDSVQAAEARATAERKVFVETTSARDVSEELKNELVAAWDAANGVASVDMAGNISLAASEAARLTAQLDQVLTRFTALNPITPAQQDEDALFSQPVLSTSATRQNQQRAVTNFDRLINPKRRSGGGGGDSAAREAEREQKAIDDLIASLDRQNDILRETDPVQKEMIRNRRVLANATKAEKATVEELIEARIREEEAIERNSERADFYGSILSSAFDTASEKGAKLDDVLKNIAGSLLDATIQAAIFGDGPFGGLFGGGSIIDMILPQKKAEGGMIYGPGGPKADKVPVLASAGEFMMNAQATTKYRAVLEAMNAGAPIQALAAGGPIGRSAPASNANGAPGAVTIHVNVTGANGNTEIMEMVSEGVGIAIERFSDFVLPGRVSEISSNPRRVG